MNILITGASGFIGYHLSEKLSRNKNNKLFLTDNFYRGKNDIHFKKILSKRNVKFIKANLIIKKNLNKLPKKVDIVFHLAAINGTDKFYSIPDKVLKTNTLININIFDYYKDKAKIIYASSSEVYASTTSLLKNRIPSSEKIELSINDITNVRYSYALSKMHGEAYLFALNKISDISFSIIRFHNIYGPRMGNNHVIPELINRIKENDHFINLNGYSNSRSFCYVDDAVKALLIISKKINNNIVHIGNDKEEIKIIHLLKTILLLMKKNLKIIKKDAPLGSVLRRLPNLSKLKSYGFNPSINLITGLKKTIKWYEKN